MYFFFSSNNFESVTIEYSYCVFKQCNNLSIGNYNAKKLFSGQLEGNFRLSYHAKLFEETLLYKGLKDWEEGQEEYQLFMPMDEIKSI